jgi:ankyrin repeat protein
MQDSFIEAVRDGDIEAVRAGLANGRDPNLPDRYGWIALHRAATCENGEVGKLLIEAGSSLTATGTDEWTPLHLAAVSGSSTMVKVLAEAGADVNALSICGDTPLHLCVISRQAESAQTLLEAGANPNLENQKGLTPLAEANMDGSNAVADVIHHWLNRI